MWRAHPVLAAMTDAHDNDLFGLDPKDDDVGAVRVNPNRRIELLPLAGRSGKIGN
jgi:hypothetical protein